MIYIASDHTGFEMKKNIISKLKEKKIKIIDKSIIYKKDDDYPDIVESVCKEIKQDDLAIIICGTGIGTSIAANKIKGIRAAVCNDIYTAKMTRTDNNANVLCLGSRTEYSKNINNVIKIVETFLNTEFSNEQRHIRRINKIKEMEENW